MNNIIAEKKWYYLSSCVFWYYINPAIYKTDVSFFSCFCYFYL